MTMTQRGAPPPNYRRIILALVLAFAFVGLVGWAAGWAEGAEPEGRNRGGRVVFAYQVHIMLSPAVWDVERRRVRIEVLDGICKAVDVRAFARVLSGPPHMKVFCIVPNRRPEASGA